MKKRSSPVEFGLLAARLGDGSGGQADRGRRMPPSNRQWENHFVSRGIEADFESPIRPIPAGRTGGGVASRVLVGPDHLDGTFCSGEVHRARVGFL